MDTEVVDRVAVQTIRRLVDGPSPAHESALDRGFLLEAFDSNAGDRVAQAGVVLAAGDVGIELGPLPSSWSAFKVRWLSRHLTAA
jgi:hypothetical protein